MWGGRGRALGGREESEEEKGGMEEASHVGGRVGPAHRAEGAAQARPGCQAGPGRHKHDPSWVVPCLG